jgi:hypothetical protein
VREAWKSLRFEIDAAKGDAKGSLSTLDVSGTEGEGLCLLVLSIVAISKRELDSAEAYGQRALDVFRGQDHRWGITTALLVLTHIAMNRKRLPFSSLLEESAALLESGPDRWGKAHVLNLRGDEALNNLDLDRALDLHAASHELAVELGDRAGQAENLLALGHIHLLRARTADAALALQEDRSPLEQLQDHHQLAHADQALALLAISTGRDAEGKALFQDVTRRLGEMGLAMMGGAYALGIADLYRRAEQSRLARPLLRHAMTLINPIIQSVEYAAPNNRWPHLLTLERNQHDWQRRSSHDTSGYGPRHGRHRRHTARSGGPEQRAEGSKMAEEQGRGTGAGRPALNIERIYQTTIPAEEIAQTLADHFRTQEFEAQVYRTSGDRTVMQARKESLWRQLLGVTYALTVVFTPGEGQLSISLGGHEWVDAAVSGAIGLVAVPPVLLGTAYGIWKENRLDQEVWQVIDNAVSASAPEKTPASESQ